MHKRSSVFFNLSIVQIFEVTAEKYYFLFLTLKTGELK